MRNKYIIIRMDTENYMPAPIVVFPGIADEDKNGTLKQLIYSRKSDAKSFAKHLQETWPKFVYTVYKIEET